MIYFLSLSLYLILYLSIYLFIYLSSSKICLVTDSPIVVKFGYWLIPHFSKIWLLTDSSFLYYLAIDSFPILVILSISVRAPVIDFLFIVIYGLCLYNIFLLVFSYCNVLLERYIIYWNIYFFLLLSSCRSFYLFNFSQRYRWGRDLKKVL